MCVCQHNNFRTIKHRMMKLGGRCTVHKSRPSSNVGGIAPWVRTPKNVALGYDVRKISAGCVVFTWECFNGSVCICVAVGSGEKHYGTQ